MAVIKTSEQYLIQACSAYLSDKSMELLGLKHAAFLAANMDLQS